MTNLNGKAYAMTAITPMKPWKTPILRFLFWFTATVPGQTDDLVNLSFIHFARWVIVRRDQFPRLSESQPKEKLSYDYLIFFSNFNGTWNQYIDAFSQVLAYGLDRVWKWSEKFTGAVPVTAFKRYITRGQVEVDYYYNSYPYASTNDIKAAHRVNAAFEQLAAATDRLSPEEFDQAWLQFLTQVQSDLGSLGSSPVGT